MYKMGYRPNNSVAELKKLAVPTIHIGELENGMDVSYNGVLVPNDVWQWAPASPGIKGAVIGDLCVGGKVYSVTAKATKTD